MLSAIRLAEVCSCSQCKQHPQRQECSNRQPKGCCVIYSENGYWRLSAATTDRLEEASINETKSWIMENQRQVPDHATLMNYTNDCYKHWNSSMKCTQCICQSGRWSDTVAESNKPKIGDR